MRLKSLLKGRYVALLCLSLALFASPALASKPIFETPDQKELLRAAHSLKNGHQEDAARLFKRAAEWGNKDAQKTLGLMYVKGLGCQPNKPCTYH